MARSRRPLRAVLFDAGNTLLEVDYAVITAHLRTRGHDVENTMVIDAERRARVRLERERASHSTPDQKGEGRYLRYLLGGLGITDDTEQRAIAEWRRGDNLPVGLCHRADAEAQERDCPTAAGLCAAVELALASSASSESR